MLYQFAITPDAFEPVAVNEHNPPGVVLTELLRGLCENGLLANLNNGGWLKEVIGHLQKLGPNEKQSLQKLLEVLHKRGRLIKHPTGSSTCTDDDFRWLRWGIERQQAADIPLAGVISTDDFIECSELANNSLIPLDSALTNDCWVNRQTSIELFKNLENLARHIPPILHYARTVTLIDPFINCDERRFTDPLQLITSLLGKHDGNQEPGRVHIHTSCLSLGSTINPAALPQWAARELTKWESKMGQIARNCGHRFKITLWNKRPENDRPHDRYIITDQCGIAAPGGLDYRRDGNQRTTWSLLAPKTIENLLRKEYSEENSPHEFLHSIEFSLN